MIQVVNELLREMSLIKRDGEPPFYVSFNRNFNFFVFSDEEDFYQVKVSSGWPLRNEYEGLKSANVIFGDSVPQPLGYYERGGFEILVCRGIKHRKIRLHDDGGKTFWSQIQSIIRRSLTSFLEEGPLLSHMEHARAALEYFKDRPFVEQMRDMVEHLSTSGVTYLPHIKQHGDFTTHNMGLSGEKLIIFDWEDFGKITIPGFDVFCMTLDVETGFDRKKIERILQTKEYSAEVNEVIDCFCGAIGIDRKLYFDLYPVYVLWFLFLKERYGYSRGIGEILEKVLDVVLEKGCSI